MEKNTRVALVTGANSGIGYATAKVLKKQGNTVIMIGRRKDAIEAAAHELDAIPLVADQSSIKDIEQLAATVTEKFGQLDILVINAVSPGPTQTEVFKNAGYDAQTIDQLKDYTRNAVPLKKVGTPDNVGRMIAYLSSPAADFITGSEIVMDGGMLLV